MEPQHKGSDADNSHMPKRSFKVLSLNEMNKWMNKNIYNLIRKRKSQRYKLQNLWEIQLFDSYNNN